MRKVLSISLQGETIKLIDRQVKERHFPSTSDYIRHLVENEEEMITEQDVLKYASEARRDYKLGKTKVLRSLRDLM